MKTDTFAVLDTLRKTIESHQMFTSGDSVLIGVSGGADSVCLLHALNTLKKELGITIAAAHLNHGIRGEEADRDAAFVKELCHRFKVPCLYKREDIPAFVKEFGVSEETAGRLRRYQFFRDVCTEEKFNKIATAHNRNDQAETVLMRILRGCGIDGLSGIRYLREDGVVRPLLDVERSQIEGYCKENQLDYCTDSTNQDEMYTRNRIRHRLLPMIQEEFNPNIVTALATMAENMAEDSDFISGYASRLYERINSPAPAKKPVVLDIETLSMLQESICNRLILLAAKDAMGKDYRLERDHLEMVNGLLLKETGTSFNLPGGLVVAVRYGWLAFETQGENKSFADEIHYEVEIGRTYEVGELSISLELKEMPVTLQKGEMVLDYDKVEHLPLTIRTRRRGDRIAVFQDGHERKLKDFLIDAKIPVTKRGQIPLLCSENKVIAVIGHRIAEPYKRDKETKRGLVIRYGESM